MILTRGQKIETDSLPSEVLRRALLQEVYPSHGGRASPRALGKTKGNHSQAAKILEISHSALLNKVNKKIRYRRGRILKFTININSFNIPKYSGRALS